MKLIMHRFLFALLVGIALPGGLLAEAPPPLMSDAARQTCENTTYDTIPAAIKAVSGIELSADIMQRAKTVGLSSVGLDTTIQGIVPGSIADEIGLQVGDKFVQIAGRSNIQPQQMSGSLCNGMIQIATIKRGAEAFDVVLSEGAISLLDRALFSIEVDNPFSPGNPYTFADPVWEAVFDGDFSRFSETEKAQLIVIATQVMSKGRAGNNWPAISEEALESLKANFSTAQPCFPYGVSTLTYDQFKFSDGRLIGKVNEWDNVHDPRLRKIVKENYDSVRWITVNPSPITKMMDTYGCISVEYRQFYDRILQLAQ